MKQHSIVMDDDHISASDEWAQDIVSNVALFLFLAWCFLLLLHGDGVSGNTASKS